MGCLKSKLTSTKKRKSKNKTLPEAFYAKQHDSQPTVRLSGEDVLRQLQEEGIVPSRKAPGGVAFSVPVDDSNTSQRLRKPPRRLERLSTKPHYTRDERHMIAEITRLDRMIEQVQKKALERDCKRRMINQEKERQNMRKKLQAQTIVAMKEERMKKFRQEREAAKKRAVEKKEAKRKAVLAARRAMSNN